MLSNPIQQIERTQDAYAGNPEGLQKRANMSKELIDLLAMQALQSDLAAQKRNMAMQQQGNPQTVKDQLEEGLMGEYRQKAAKDLGVGPSEGDVVERAGIAGQQMARNQQMAQGPQGMPQGGGGVASQAGPVNLAGGGIVSFAGGMSVNAPEKPGFFSQFSLPDMDAVRRMEERDEASRLKAESEGALRIKNITADEIIENINAAMEGPKGKRTLEKEEALAALAALADEEAGVLAQEDLETERNAALKEELAAEVAQEGIASVSPPTPTVDPRQALIDNISGLAAVDPYTPDTDLTAYTKKQMERDPAKEAEAAAARVAEFSKLEEGLGALTDRRQRATDLYEERQEAKKGRGGAFMAQLIGMSQGPAGSGAEARMSYYEKQEAIRDKHEANLNAIDDASILLQRTVGAKQATEYNLTAKAADTAIANAANTLAGMDAAKRSDYLARVELQMEDQKAKLDVLNEMGREDRENAALTLSREQITLDTADAIFDASTAAIETYLTQISEARALIMPRFRKRLKEAEGDAAETALIRKEINEELQNATIAQHDLLNEAREKQKEAEKILTSRMTSSSAISGKTGDKINTALGI